MAETLLSEVAALKARVAVLETTTLEIRKRMDEICSDIKSIGVDLRKIQKIEDEREGALKLFRWLDRLIWSGAGAAIAYLSKTFGAGP